MHSSGWSRGHAPTARELAVVKTGSTYTLDVASAASVRVEQGAGLLISKGQDLVLTPSPLTETPRPHPSS